MTTIAVVVHRHSEMAAELAVDIASWLTAKDHTVHVDAADADTWPDLLRWAGPAPQAADFVVSIGGDGTMLRAVHLAAPLGAPVLGVNVGHLGYLTVIEPAAWEPALTRLLEGAFQIDERLTLDVAACGSRRSALNDAVIEKLESGHTVRVAVTVSGKPAIAYTADALIVATPTGSTAYNLSAGGPLMSPRLGGMVVTPVAAHSLLGRSVIVAPDEVVQVELLDGAAALSIDGQPCARLAKGDVVECCAGAEPARLVAFEEPNFWAVLKAKLGLNGGDPSSSS